MCATADINKDQCPGMTDEMGPLVPVPPELPHAPGISAPGISAPGLAR